MTSAKPKPIDLLEPEQRSTAQRRYSKMLLWINGIPVGVVLVFVGVIYVLRAQAGKSNDTLMLALLIVTGVMLVFLGINYGLFRLLRHRGVWWAQPSPLLAVRFKDRRRLMRALRRDQPAPDDIAPAVVHASMQWLSRMRVYMMIAPAVALMLIAANTVIQQTRAHNTFLLVYNCVLAVLIAVIAVRRNLPVTRHSRRRLEQNEPL